MAKCHFTALTQSDGQTSSRPPCLAVERRPFNLPSLYSPPLPAPPFQTLSDLFCLFPILPLYRWRPDADASFVPRCQALCVRRVLRLGDRPVIDWRPGDLSPDIGKEGKKKQWIFFFNSPRQTLAGLKSQWKESMSRPRCLNQLLGLLPIGSSSRHTSFPHLVRPFRFYFSFSLPPPPSLRFQVKDAVGGLDSRRPAAFFFSPGKEEGGGDGR